MKLHHFITKEVTNDGDRIRNLGKALLPTAPVVKSPVELAAPVIEAAKKVATKAAPTEIKADGDVTQKLRDFAEDQLEKTSPHVHRKIRHFD